MFLAPFVFTRTFLDSASSTTSASEAARCRPACTRCYCCSRRVPLAVFSHLTMETANYMLPSPSPSPNWLNGNHGLEPEELRWKRRRCGNWEVGAFTFETPTAIFWN